ncbi:putative cell wall-binding protein [Agromyces terreus]|uniref:Cell wall-binding protein n=1 Tax=Agromyces terreus TaxID=424795 RepID=A0A9X2KCF0_9MICO|nr:cell wall-binding repeat-containing protein [Agromyces terreus]MCP2371306.1 putative cell wall-binding protein [Agromyces terreus]
MQKTMFIGVVVGALLSSLLVAPGYATEADGTPDEPVTSQTAAPTPTAAPTAPAAPTEAPSGLPDAPSTGDPAEDQVAPVGQPEGEPGEDAAAEQPAEVPTVAPVEELSDALYAEGDDTVSEADLYAAHLKLQAEKADDPDAAEDTAGEDADAGAAEVAETAAAEQAADARVISTLLSSSSEPEAQTLGAAADAGTVASAAAVGSSFTAGNLISDANFANGSAMTEAEIQAFLTKTVGSCQNSYCLANYRQNTPTRTWSFGTCTTYAGANGESAARIIYKVQRACKLSAKVILVTLQKEQSLLTSRAPTAGVMQKAMGYGCPDTAACDSTYYGFFNQVFAAARQLTWYGNPAGSFTWIKVGASNRIAYHPSSSCGTGAVTIANRATAALYYYTPYQPNKAALANLYGTGDSCSAYGNRNFWRMYTDWFGDPRVASAIPMTRRQGADRYATAAAISKAAFPSRGVSVAYIASGAAFADALAAAPAAARRGGPLLLTQKSALPSSTLAELKRLAPKQIIVVGGTGAVSNAVASSLKAVAPVQRIGGVDRYDTSRRIVADAFGDFRTVYVATGRDFPDALTAAAVAASLHIPVVLVDGRSGSVPAATRTLLTSRGVDQVRIAGGTGAVSSGIQSALAKSHTVSRYSGPDRFSTSVSLNSVIAASPNAYLATGMAYPDALAGAVAAGRADDPLYLAQTNCMPSPVRAALLKQKVTSLVLLGGPGALTDRVTRLALC